MLFLEGNIGAGKSSFLQILSDHLDCEVIFEPHQRWQGLDGGDNILDLFYTEPKRWSYTFETYTLLTRLLDHQIHISSHEGKTVISERSPYSGRYCFAANTYDSGHFNKLEWALYQSLCDFLFKKHVAKPTGIIYLKTDPKVCFERIQKRNRSEESTVPLKYLQELHAKHEDWLIEKTESNPLFEDVPILVLDGNLPYLYEEESKVKLINLVSDFFNLNKISNKTLQDSKQFSKQLSGAH